MRKFEEDVARINKRIFDYNLQAPAERFQIRVLNVGKEIEENYSEGAK